MAQLSPESQIGKDGANQTNLARGSKEVKDKRLKDAKDIVEQFNEAESASPILKMGVGIIFSLILYVVTYIVVAFILFPRFDIITQALYAGLFSGVIGTVFSILIIVALTFFDHRDYALLSLLCPPVALFGVFSKKIRKIVGIYLIFILFFVILTFASVMLLCIEQGITVNQLLILMKSNMISTGSTADKILNGIKEFFSYLLGLDDPKYKK